MNRRDLFRLAGAVAVAPRAMLAAPVAPQFMSGAGNYLPSNPTSRLLYLIQLREAGIVEASVMTAVLDGA